jgi:hypothetical protein
MIHDKIAKLGKYPQHLSDLLDMGHEIATLGGLYVEQNAWLVKALALAREWIASAHQDGCWVATRTDGDCDCGRAEVLAAITPPGEET